MSGAVRLLAALGLAAPLALAVPAVGPSHPTPFHATDSGVAEVVGGSGSVLRTSDVAIGHGTYVGVYTLRGTETVDRDSGEITDGEFTITAEDGSTLSGTYTGRAQAGLSSYDVSGPVTDGTGRFEGAEGFLAWHGTYDARTSAVSDRVVGLLTW